MPNQDLIRVLFVCMGNICRSPAAEGIFSDIVRQHGLTDQFLVDSAGTIGYHSGSPADRRMREAAKKRGLDLTSRARQVTHSDLDEFDWVIAMDRQNLSDLQSVHSKPSSQVRLLSSFFESSADWPADVPDPYYGGDEGFEYVLDMLQSGCPKLLAEILRTNRI